MKHLVSLVLMSLIIAVPFVAVGSDDVVIYGGINEKPAVAPVNISPVEVAVNSTAFFVIPGPAIGYSAWERSEITDTRITQILSTAPLAPVTVKQVRDKPTIYVGKVRLITVYPADVRNARMASSMELAEKWAQSTAAALQIVAPTAFRGEPRSRGVYASGRQLFEIYDANGYESVAARVSELENRMADIESRIPDAASKVTVKQSHGIWAVYAANDVVVTPTQVDVEGNHAASRKALAMKWANIARAAFAQSAQTQ